MRVFRGILEVTVLVSLMTGCKVEDDDKKKASTTAGTQISGDVAYTAAVEKCAFANGTNKVSGTGKAQCDKLKAEIGADKAIAVNVSGSASACAFDVNGVKEESDDAATCEALKKKYAGLMPTVSSVTAGQTVQACVYIISGVKEEGNSKAACDALAKKNQDLLGTKNPGAALPSSSVSVGSSAGGSINIAVSCAYSVNGVVESYQTKAECDALAARTGTNSSGGTSASSSSTGGSSSTSTTIGGTTTGGTTTTTADGTTSTTTTGGSSVSTGGSASGTTSVEFCAYARDGKNYQGSTKAECDAIRAQLGI